MKCKHTPGPWVVCPKVNGQEQEGKVGTGPSGWLGVAQVYGDTPEEVRANTLLIAAAPDLLGTLVATEEKLRLYAAKEGHGVLNECILARLVIGKATAKCEAVNVDSTYQGGSFTSIQTAIAKMYRAEADPEQTAVTIAGLVCKESLAEFVVDAFNRGWISNSNLGIDDDGKVI